MKKFVLAGLGLFLMAGFLPASVQEVNSHVECFGTTCGFVGCIESNRELTNQERLGIYDLIEEFMCED